MKVPFVDLHAQFRSIESDVRAAIDRVIASQRFVFGPEVQAAENEIAAYSSATHAIGVSSGTDAILVGLMALGVGPDDEVITTPFTFVATTMCIARLGARAVFVDIDPRTYAIDTSKLESAIGPRTRAIVPVHLFGQMANMKQLLAVAAAHHVPVLEDGAQAIGARYNGEPMGKGSSGATLSFFPSKNLGCMGDGGMVISNDADFASRVRLLRNHGQEPKYISRIVGGNFRLDAMQAAIVRAKLPYLEGWTRARQNHAKSYCSAFHEAKLNPELLSLPYEAEGVHHVYNQFVVRTKMRDRLRAHLEAHGIATAVYYPLPMHLQPCFAFWGYAKGSFPEAERAACECLALPIYPELEPSAIEHVVSEIVAFFSQRENMR
ncbi:MAG: DegT/DnrJ/EryC1/StrS family aminotransferase [Polyangiaceae bacterium]|nr:DegT/DnrJ/EryC1/StrS family aminotransferase [Polyangiaceae bacterium]